MGEQIITTPAGDRLVVIPEAEYLAMREALEERDDIAAVETFRRRLAAGEEELVPAEIVNRILDGENKVRVWRGHRGMTARDLAAKASVSASYLSQIESGARDGSFETIKRIAAALGLSVDDLA
jgi:DNA-binding XRE family transcriptional regulator